MHKTDNQEKDDEAMHTFLILFPNVRSLSFLKFPFMGMFDWEEGLIPLAQSPGGSAPTQAISLQFNKIF